MNNFNAYAAMSAKGPLKAFSFDPGKLGPEEVEIKVSHCGGKARYRIVLENDLA